MRVADIAAANKHLVLKAVKKGKDTVEKVCKETTLGERTVLRYLRELREEGKVVVLKKGRYAPAGKKP